MINQNDTIKQKNGVNKSGDTVMVLSKDKIIGMLDYRGT